ncbi:MAG: hypothetical protein M3N45_13455 [Actinomycetota bacterium]|nr:hypothetical protein [Actinomycetota bacterium]
MGLAVVSLLVLAVIGALGSLILACVFGVAVPRNENRPGSGSEDERDLTSYDEPAPRGPAGLTRGHRRRG